MTADFRWFLLAFWVLVQLGVLAGGAAGPVRAAESSEESIALYADAANFQTGGAYELAIESWQKFLERYPEDPLASKAAHYLGVCLMQKEHPDHEAAAEAFGTALRDREYELREESLANQAWCYYAAAGDGPEQDPQLLKRAIATFETLLKENPKTDYVDRAYFYSGEAAYGLGERQRAIEFYNEFLASPAAKQSPLRCEAMYARGIAQEELQQADQAIQSFRQALADCGQSSWVADVHLRLGDLRIGQGDYAAAIESFDAAIETSEAESDKSYALYRQAYALVKAGQPERAAERYDRLREEFPKSPYAKGATLAAGQSLYRGGQFEQAAQRFSAVLGQDDAAAATEAAHWLARIRLSQGDAAAAAAVARKQVEAGIEGDFAIDLRVDLAEALSRDPQTVPESITLGEQIFRDAPQDPLAPRALYNAAFSALQIGRYEKAGELSRRFLEAFAGDDLAADVRFILAESQLLSGQTRAAAESYQTLLKDAPADGPQRPLWVLRAALAFNTLGEYERSLGLLREELPRFKQADRQAEAHLLVGRALLRLDRPAEAAESLQRALQVAPDWSRRGETVLLRGTALLAAGELKQARQVWRSLIEADAEAAMADQARYKLAQAASDAGQHAEAVRWYDQIIEADRVPNLIPYALYGRGWSLMQQDQHPQAIGSLDAVIARDPPHPLRDDALIARGVCHRVVEDLAAAREDLQAYLELAPKGNNLGHVLYELALVDQQQQQHAEAAERLRRLVRDVPGYPDMDKALYELGWSLRQAGREREAVDPFNRLLEQHPETPLAAEAAYYVGQQHYKAGEWSLAAAAFRQASQRAREDTMGEKSLYRLGWSLFKDEQLEAARKAFAEQAERYPEGPLSIDARMMVGECLFQDEQYESALRFYSAAREQIRQADESAETVRDAAERQVRELVLLHGGQSAAQLQRWEAAIGWYEELKTRFPATAYLPQLFYETGFAYQQQGEDEEALNYYRQVAEKYRRREVGARARFMRGEIYFGKDQFDQAIPEFQRVMYGFGGEQAPESIKNWQAKSGFEAGRCSESLMKEAGTEQAKQRARGFAQRFYRYVVEKHPRHELAEKSAKRLEALQES